MSSVYHQDEGGAELDIRETVIPLSLDCDISGLPAGRLRTNTWAAALVRYNKNQSCLVLVHCRRSIFDPATSRSRRGDFSEALKSPRHKRHRHQEQEENEMKFEDMKQLIEQQTKEITKAVSANPKRESLWPQIAIAITIILALFVFHYNITRDIKSFGKDLYQSQQTLDNRVNDKLMDFTNKASEIQTTVDKGFSDIKAELSQFEVRLTTDVNNKLMDFRKDLSQSQQTILEQIHKAKTEKQQ